MKVLSLFNNKGGVGKTTLTYHLAHILATSVAEGGCGKKVLLMDLDPQSNLTIFSIQEETIREIWDAEKPFMDMKQSFQAAKEQLSEEAFSALLHTTRTLHFLLKPTEEGISDEDILPPPFHLNEEKTLGIIPGRSSLYKYETSITQRWSATYIGVPLSLRTITKIRNIAQMYAEKYGYDYVIMDTSPSLDMLNKVVISMADGFIIPCFPDLFSLYGIRNIGESLKAWESEFTTMNYILSSEQRKDFPKRFVQFLGYTIFNAPKHEGKNAWNLSQAHYHYAQLFPQVIKNNILVPKPLPDEVISLPIGETVVMHSHNIFPSQAQKYKVPMWELPMLETELGEDFSMIKENQLQYLELKKDYYNFAENLLERIKYLEVETLELVAR